MSTLTSCMGCTYQEAWLSRSPFACKKGGLCLHLHFPGEHWSCWALKVPFLSAFPAEATLMFSGECGSAGDEEEGQPWVSC